MWSVSSLLRPEIPEVSQGQGPGVSSWFPEAAFPWLSDGPSWVQVGVWSAQQPAALMETPLCVSIPVWGTY